MLNPFRVFPVVTVRGGRAVQSFNYEHYRPLGDPAILVQNFDRWKVCEILINCIDATSKFQRPDFSLVEKLAYLNVSTPLTYGGGIKSCNDGVRLINVGCDRLLVETGFWDEPNEFIKLSSKLGKQALILSMPIIIIDGECLRYDYRTNNVFPIHEKSLSLIDEIFSEVILIDKENEGRHSAYNIRPNVIRLKSAGKILFGGISTESQISKYAKDININACAIGNFASHKELFLNSDNKFKRNLK